MKKYSRLIKRLNDRDAKKVSTIRNKEGEFVREVKGVADFSYSADNPPLLSSEEFISSFKGYIDDIAKFKTVDKRKFMRSLEYAAVGIMDLNDVQQEAYLAFLEAYIRLDWDKISLVNENERGAMIWSFLKKSTILNLERQLRDKKDGVRVTEWALFKSESVNTNLITTLFSQLDKVFFRNQEDVAMTRYETDLVGAFMDVHMDYRLDLTRNGNRDMKKNERAIIKALYGLDQPRMTYAELSDYYQISQSTIRKVKQRAIERLSTEESKEEIAYFLHEYRINTQADTEKYRK